MRKPLLKVIAISGKKNIQEVYIKIDVVTTQNYFFIPRKMNIQELIKLLQCKDRRYSFLFVFSEVNTIDLKRLFRYVEHSIIDKYFYRRPGVHLFPYDKSKGQQAMARRIDAPGLR